MKGKSRLNYAEIVELIETQKPSVHKLKDVISELGENLICAEIGTFMGASAEFMLDQCPNISMLYVIDPWGEQVDVDVFISVKEAEKNFVTTMKRLERFKGRYTILRKTSMDAYNHLKSMGVVLDFTFIDGCHDYDSVSGDIKMFTELTRDLGIISGHDFQVPDVKKAVDDSQGDNDPICVNMPCYMTMKNGSLEAMNDLQVRSKRNVLLVATPMYNSNAHLNYVHSVVDIAQQSGMEVEYYWLGNESLITRARNICVDYFLKNKRYSKLLWLDSDVMIKGPDVRKLCEAPYDVVGAPIRIKDMSCVRYSINGIIAQEGDYVEAVHQATGVLLMSRKAVEALYDHATLNNELYINHKYLEPGESRYMRDIFKVGIYDKSIPLDERIYVSEDYWVCNDLRKLGYRIMIDTSIETIHSGTMQFVGNTPIGTETRPTQHLEPLRLIQEVDHATQEGQRQESVQ